MGSERDRKTKICVRQKSTGHKGIGTGRERKHFANNFSWRSGKEM